MLKLDLIFLISLFSSEVNAGFFYKSAEDREKLVQAERAFTDEKVKRVIELKRKVCEGNEKGFIVINQKVRCLLLQKMLIA